MRIHKNKVETNNEKGQGMTEYIIIVALIAIASITIVGFFGDKVRGLFAGSGDKLDGTLTPGSNTNQSNATYNSSDVDKNGAF